MARTETATNVISDVFEAQDYDGSVLQDYDNTTLFIKENPQVVQIERIQS